MISGSRNLAYISRGARTYGRKPIVARARGLWELAFVIAGRARPAGVDCRGTKSAGPRLYLSPPDSSHGWTDDADNVSEVFVLHFRDVPDELRDCVAPARPTLVELGGAEYRQLSAMLERVWGESATKSLVASLQVHQLMIQIARLVVTRLHVDGRSPISRDVVGRALNWMEENLGEGPDVEDAARAVGVSAPHLRRLFAAEGRPSPKTELTRLRIEAAQRCLRAKWKQEAIAQFLGYSDVSSFARVFRSVCNMPPGIWLARNQ